MSISPTLALLETIFPGQVVIPVIKAGTALSLAPQTTRNKISAGEFPVTTFLLGGKRVVRKSDLAAYIDNLGTKKRGRPSKTLKAMPK